MGIKISVLVAAYNSEAFIGRCIRSLLDQTANNIPYHNNEIILINDGSIDKTKFAINLFQKPKDNRIKIINNDKNIGLPASLNKGIKEASGEYIVRVDSDDYVNVNFLSSLAFYLDSYKETSAISCDYILVDKDEKIIRTVSSKDEPIACGIMFRKDCLVDIGMYDEKFRCMEEKELRMRFEKKYKIDHLNLPLYRYRKHSQNMTNSLKSLNKYKDLLEKVHPSLPLKKDC